MERFERWIRIVTALLLAITVLLCAHAFHTWTESRDRRARWSTEVESDAARRLVDHEFMARFDELSEELRINTDAVNDMTRELVAELKKQRGE